MLLYNVPPKNLFSNVKKKKNTSRSVIVSCVSFQNANDVIGFFLLYFAFSKEAPLSVGSHGIYIYIYI